MRLTKKYIDSIRARASGEDIGIFLGPLECWIMEEFWSVYPHKLTCRGAYKRLYNGDFIRSPSTIAETIHRLEKRGLINKLKGNGKGSTAHEFAAMCSREVFVEMSMMKVIRSLHDSFPDEFDKIVDMYFMEK